MGISQFLTVAANTASGNPEPSVGVVVATGDVYKRQVLRSIASARLFRSIHPSRKMNWSLVYSVYLACLLYTSRCV